MVASPTPNPQSSRVENGTGSSRTQKRLYSYNDDDTSTDRGAGTQREHAEVSRPYALRLYSYNGGDASINRGVRTQRKHAEVSSPYVLRQLPDLVSSLCQDFSLVRRCSTAARHNIQEPMAVVDVATNTPLDSCHSETARLHLTTYISVDRHVSCVCRYDKCIQELKTRRVGPSSENEERLRSETAFPLPISEQTQTSLLSDILKPREASGRGGCAHHKVTVSQKEGGHRAGSERRWKTLAVVDNIPEMYEPESSYQPQLDNSDCTLPFLVLDKEVATCRGCCMGKLGG